MATLKGRFAPSPTGPLHAGSLVAALASWLDARAHGGRWLVRMEDVDTPRCSATAARRILQQLADCGLQSDEPVLWQSQRHSAYQAALDTLIASGLAYACRCSRKDVLAALRAQGVAPARHGELIYPGTCRPASTAVTQPHPPAQRLPKSQALPATPCAPTACAWRLHTGLAMPFYMQNRPIALYSTEYTAIHSEATASVHWHDRRLGAQQQGVVREVGDFVLQRADHCFAYQLAVVVDDAAQGITHVVRGEDLVDNTARQILLQHALGLPTPTYLHTPLVLGPNGEKLSKQNGALAVDTAAPLVVLNAAAAALGLPAHAGPVGDALAAWVAMWAAGSVGIPRFNGSEKV